MTRERREMAGVIMVMTRERREKAGVILVMICRP